MVQLPLVVLRHLEPLCYLEVPLDLSRLVHQDDPFHPEHLVLLLVQVPLEHQDVPLPPELLVVP